jgi:hypothetical protein
MFVHLQVFHVVHLHVYYVAHLQVNHAVHLQVCYVARLQVDSVNSLTAQQHSASETSHDDMLHAAASLLLTPFILIIVGKLPRTHREGPGSVRALKSPPADRREHLAIDILAGSALRRGQHTSGQRVLQEIVLPRREETPIIEEYNGVGVEALRDVLADALDGREDQIRP